MPATRFHPVLLLCSWSVAAVAYEDDARLATLLRDLGDNTAMNLPFDRDRREHTGRAGNDYSLRMAYAAERRTALYAGGNHNDGRRNDCWEYHLGSNTWHRLFPDEGGDHYFLKGIVMHRMREFKAKRKETMDSATLDDLRVFLTDADRKTLDERIIPWWKQHVVLKDGLVCTAGGGPLMPSHTWDGLTYDPLRKRLVWSAGAGPNGECYDFHRLVSGMSAEEMAAARDPRCTEMWEFAPAEAKWTCYRRPMTGPCPDFRGMGQSLEFLPDQGRFIWYIAAANVTPHSYQMWSLDPRGDAWTELRPNGGRSIRDLVQANAAPDGEQVVRYSPTQRRLYGFRAADVFSYDPATDTWAKVGSDARIAAHDAESLIAHDPANDVFIYTRKDAEGDLARFAIFDPATARWEVPRIHGDPLPRPQYEQLKGFFDPVHGVYVVVAGGWTPTWVYRYRKTGR